MKNEDYKIDFIWRRERDGYVWANNNGDITTSAELFNKREVKEFPNPPYLAAKDPESEIETYRPLDNSALFANFADIEGTPDNFIIWSGKYGILTNGEKVSNSELLVLNVELADEPERLSCCSTESLEFWIKEHNDLSFVLMVWEFVINKDIERLKRIIQWRGNDQVVIYHVGKGYIDEVDRSDRFSDWGAEVYDQLEESVIFDKYNTRPWLSKLCKYPDVIKPAAFYVQSIISNKLKDYPLYVDIKADTLDGKMLKELRPSSLLSAMWYQFSLVFTGEEKIRRCAICNMWEDMRGHRGSWKRHKTCASHERVKSFRKNK